jgi:hypothetical protein
MHKETCCSRIAYFQDTALTNGSLIVAQKYNQHAVVASLLVLIPNVVPITPLMEYAEKASFIFPKSRICIFIAVIWNLSESNLQGF